jgi:hypothetical protein
LSPVDQFQLKACNQEFFNLICEHDVLELVGHVLSDVDAELSYYLAVLPWSIFGNVLDELGALIDILLARSVSIKKCLELITVCFHFF